MEHAERIEPQKQTEQGVSRFRWYTLFIVLLPTLLVSLNTYMIQVALPSIQDNLGASFSEAQLVVTGFSLGLAVALIIGGKLGDLYGRRRMLVLGVAGFTLMAVCGGLATEPAWLVIIRIVQGMMAAVIQPQVLSVLQTNFLSKEKPLVFSIYGAMIGIGFAFGLILGGVVINWNLMNMGWRTVFFFNLPFGVLLLAGLPFVPESYGRRSSGLDWKGTLLLMAGLLLLIYPLSEGQKQGWPLWIWLCMAAAIPQFFLFFRQEKHLARNGGEPLINFAVFINRSFSLGLIAVMVVYIGMFAFFFILSYYLQYGLHYTVQQTSMVFLPLGTGFFLTSLLSGQIVRRWGVKTLQLGAFIMGASCFALAALLQYDAAHMLSGGHVAIFAIYGLSLGMTTTPLVNVILGVVPKEIAGTGSGLFTTTMYVSNSFGVAFISIIFSSVLGASLQEAAFHDYVRAFSIAMLVIGLLAILASICLKLLSGSAAAGEIKKGA